ncbi:MULTISPECIES: hypothetical protein [unclassified Exiguobacterium]|uniref:hypothetical protein n=1 Tax=unclassified Exiguobacterium TaxID=2644629 RepID=UPI001BEA85E5|nr:MULTISPECIES: hypothetical protein [unclassified Exiguobacterium]
MRFFERPNLVTAVLLFLETLIVLFKLEYLLMMPFEYVLVALIILILLPLGFHAFYKYILYDLEGFKTVQNEKNGEGTRDSQLKTSESHQADVDSTKDCTKVIIRRDIPYHDEPN